MRIGLIAVSGVRIYNERLKRFGITLPGFVERAQVIASMPSLGLLTLAGATPDRHTLTYHECPDFDPAMLDSLRVDVVAISSFTAKADVMYRIADHLRSKGTRVVLGGLHCTLVPDEAAAHADAIVVGEGELAWPRLLDDLEKGRLRKVYRTAFRDVDLGASPMPRFDLLDLDAYNRIPIQTSRGCPLDCEFCAASKIFGGYKRKPVHRVIEEVRAAKRLWPRPFVELADDNTFVHKEWSRALVRALAEEDIHWFTETDVSVADDPELLDLLGRSGCRQVLIGFESPNAASLDGLDPAGWKSRRHEQYLRTIDAIQSRGVSVNGCFITGLDGDTPDTFEEIERFVRRSGLAEVQVTVMTPFPGTALHRRLKAEGRLLRDRYWEQCTLFDVAFRPKRMSVEQLEQGLEHLMGSLYTKEETERRQRGFLQTVRGGRRRAS
ncbi:MAG TPA: radical SAM protein [Planctomycetota bacterium]|nr:radical SAM protein [Planctomycetota bacterium]